MYCAKCGKLNPDTATFCPACGSSLAGAGASAPVQPQAQAPVNTYQQPVQQQAQAPVNTYQQPVQQQAQAPVNTYQQPVQPQPVQQQAQAPVNTYQQPVQPPVNTAPFFGDSGNMNSFAENAAGDPDSKKFKKGLVIGICSGIAAILAIGVILYFTLLKPQNETASDTTGNDSVTNTEAANGKADDNVSAKTASNDNAADPNTVSSVDGEASSVPDTDNGPDNGVGDTDVSGEDPAVTEIPVITPDPYVFVSTRELTNKEVKRQNKIQAYTAEAATFNGIDIFEDNYTKGRRDTSYKWDDNVFYALEGYRDKAHYSSKTRCDIKRLAFRASNGNDCEIEASMNPDTGIPNKIVLIEYLSSGIEVYEFYFDNDGKVSFIFDYLTDNYVTTFATTDKTGMRYLFHNDCMVTLRRITSSETTNISIGSAESNRMKDQFSSSKRKLYNDQSRDVRDNFDAEEDRWIDAAYNVYDLVMNTETKSTITGYVYSGNGSPLSGAKVGVFTKDFEALLFETATADDGSYRFVVPDDTYSYKIKFLCEGYLEENIYDISAGNNQVYIYQNTIYLFAEAQEASVNLTLGDALHYNTHGSGMMPLANAEILFRRGCNNRSGDILFTDHADSNGRYNGQLPSGNYTIQIDAVGFTSMFYNIVANYFDPDNRYECYATPTLNAGEYRIVLTWGEYPNDLDSHLFTGSSGHVWYGSKVDSNGNNLDVDDTSSYGPETTTIVNLKKSSYYKFCVTDYTNLSSGRPGSYDMSYSDATVYVYNSSGLAGKFDVPYGTSGTIWEVFEIRNGNVFSIQRYYNSDSNRTWWNHQ